MIFINKEYDDYLTNHKDNVKKAYSILALTNPDRFSKINDILPELSDVSAGAIIFEHDTSKYSMEEYKPYVDYFVTYKDGKKPKAVEDAFNYAWLHHIHSNPHHWQHWVLINDEDGIEALEMPDNYILEMICDWWSFSLKKDAPSEILEWYERAKREMMLAPKTKEKVEAILDIIKEYSEEKEKDEHAI